MFDKLIKEYRLHPLIIVRAIETAKNDEKKIREILDQIPSYPFVWKNQDQKYRKCKLFDTSI